MAQVTATARVVAWSPEAAAALAGATGNDPTYTITDLQREVQHGKTELYAVFVETVMLGYMALWIDNFGNTKELVFQIGAALGSDTEALKIASPLIDEIARSRGCLTIRVHLPGGQRAGLLKRHGYKKSEIVLRKLVG